MACARRPYGEVRVKGDSCGGVVTCVVRGCPRGLGAPAFDKLEADLAKAMLSLPATKGFEIGSGFEGIKMKGSEHNDEFFMDPKTGLRTRTNRSGGIQGGISNGEPIELKIAFKPTSTITQAQQTVNRDGVETELKAKGRHDPCVVPRAVPMVGRRRTGRTHHQVVTPRVEKRSRFQLLESTVLSVSAP